ncbi:MAG: polyprenyl synthetase family protein [Candidatus Cloacimonetes bacterium]|nr:polyprenyl synthetase family protein [Candidatus Cloacimonadota bacterium]
MNALTLKKDIKERREHINMVMDRYLPRKDDYPKEIHKAIRHTLFAGGKRLRPYITILTYQLYRKKITDDLVRAAAGIELLHTYTLIHDDLPEIDNDEFRRGKKTCHVAFGSDVALLAGDALLIEAFNFVNNVNIKTEIKVKMLHDMAVLSGDKGLIAGQMQDILSSNMEVTQKTLEFIHLNKTAKLIQLSSRFGAYMAEVPPCEMEKVDEFSKYLGLAFQITDDILDVEGSSKDMGKTIGKDESAKKATYPSILGLEKSKQIAEEYTSAALEILDSYGERALLFKELAHELLLRKS